ncbi:DNA adenine methylase [Aquimarina aggregata]|uniref:DNA adenine methylase n=1 Tax=Aquimarina aggregata TaxID=1642818 RepID=UPI002491AA3C|nr:Dam family site-specific DNA-(adenine-N6)-methyltransferase [Aquimarina aggregata]
MTKKEKNQSIKPFLRWAGGKNWLRKHIENFIPNQFENYYEPFLGGGSIFFYLKSKGLIKNKAYLSDTNKDLINTYRVIKNNLPELITHLSNHTDNEEEYYRIREEKFENPIEKAAQFIFLNKTSFNGIYRVNLNGKYNVPYGKKNLKNIYNFNHLKQISKILDKTYFSTQDFKVRCRQSNTNDFVFIDPPYTVAHENNGFIKYNQSIFSWKNQIQLAKITEDFENRGIHFLVTNAYHDSIKELYTTGNQIPLTRSSTIGGKGATRTNYREIIITNTEI